MAWHWIAIVSLMGVAAIWWLWQPARHRTPQSEFEKFFRAWVPRLAGGGLIFIKDASSRALVQFALYKTEGQAILHFGLPEVEWSRGAFEQVHRSLRSAGFDSQIESTQTPEVPRFVTCDVDARRESAPQEASDVARIAFAAMGVRADATFVVWSEGGVDSDALSRSFDRLLEHDKPAVRKWAAFWRSKLG
ncbi:MAG TPA: hypothetical protein VFY49_12385 [Myxococcota bacterium]|nr:hypothetical protein [Myxococcota bacterium]